MIVWDQRKVSTWLLVTSKNLLDFKRTNIPDFLLVIDSRTFGQSRGETVRHVCRYKWKIFRATGKSIAAGTGSGSQRAARNLRRLRTWFTSTLLRRSQPLWRFRRDQVVGRLHLLSSTHRRRIGQRHHCPTGRLRQHNQSATRRSLGPRQRVETLHSTGVRHCLCLPRCHHSRTRMDRTSQRQICSRQNRCLPQRDLPSRLHQHVEQSRHFERPESR